MAKLTSFEKEIFRLNRNEMQDENIQWAFCRETGITIIYKTMPKGNFIKLAVAYCNPQDTFKKKIGLITAFERWANDMAIQIPTQGYATQDVIESFAQFITLGECWLELVDE